MMAARSFSEVRYLSSGTVGFVPTMGFLHEGHLSLIEAAADRCDTVVVSIFVNPLQFGDSRDLETYPRDLARDEALARDAGAHVVFAPDVAEIYDEDNSVVVRVQGVGDAMEGIHRPGHFDGVATVVAKLFAGIQPDVAFFGRKDAQQLALVTTMAAGLSMPVEVVGCPIIRESDGLALSSRNTRLTPEARNDASRLSGALMAARELFVTGVDDAEPLTALVRRRLGDDGGISLEYVEVADAASSRVLKKIEGLTFLALAANVGGVRLIDNVFLDGRDGSTDPGIRLAKRSILYGVDTCC